MMVERIFDFYKNFCYNYFRKVKKGKEIMASALKHKQRSSRKHQFNSIPVAQFYAHAQKVAEAKFYRDMFKPVTLTDVAPATDAE